MTGDLYLIADELRAIANAGLHWAQNDYDRERYERALALSARIVAAVEEREPAEILAEYRGNFEHVTPPVGANAAVIEEGRILLVLVAGIGRWAMPGGGSEVGETLAETAERELREEAGVRGRAERFLGIWDSRLVRSALKFQMHHAAFLMGDVEGDPRPDGVETLEASYFAADALPPLARGHDVMVPSILDAIRTGAPPFFDRTEGLA